MLRIVSLLVFLSYLSVSAAFAAHPLITDDAGTQGIGKWQFELNGQYEHEHENGEKENNSEISTALTFGLTDTIDFVLGIPYQWLRTQDSELRRQETGARRQRNGDGPARPTDQDSYHGLVAKPETAAPRC